MNTAKTSNAESFSVALAAPGRAPEIPDSADVYGWLIGSWELQIVHYLVDVTARGLKGETHFGWVLEGRAVQDVWIMRVPPLHRANEQDKGLSTYGTTLRIWDPLIQAWRVTWVNPVTGSRDELIGRWCGKDIVQVGRHADGTPIRWSFTEITPESFRWLGEALETDGRTWKLEAEFRARRMETRS